MLRACASEIIITRGALGAKSSLSGQILACGNDDPFQLRILVGARGKGRACAVAQGS